MDRIIKLSDLETSVNEAYEKFKSMDEGEVSSKLEGVDTGRFAISVVLADGTKINKGDTSVPFAMGAIVKVPTALMLLSQMDAGGQEKKCGCGCDKSHGAKPDIPISAKGIRAVSAIEPVGDSDGKWTLMINNMINLMGASPVLSDRLYEKLTDENRKADVENRIAQAQFTLYDDAPIAIDLYTRLISMQATTEQLATMGATIAADGYNPVTRAEVFDGVLSQSVVGMMAAKGPHHMARKWNMRVGLPAVSGFGGGIVGVLPGVMSIAAYSPLLGRHGVSKKAAKAIKYIMNSLGVSAFASARVKIEH